MQRMPMQTVFDTLRDAYSRRDFETVASFYRLPCAVYIQDSVLVLTDSAQLKDALLKQCKKYAAMGSVDAIFHVTAQSIVRQNNFSVWALWRHLDRQGSEIFSSQVRYIFSESDSDRPLIQLVELEKDEVLFSSQELAQMNTPMARAG